MRMVVYECESEGCGAKFAIENEGNSKPTVCLICGWFEPLVKIGETDVTWEANAE